MLKKSDIQLFPKVELHCHLDGSIRPRTLQKIAKQQGLPINDSLQEVTEKMQAPVTCQNLEEYLTCFDFVLPFLQTKEALEMAAFDVMEQAFEDGVRYIEIRFAPILSMAKDLTVTETIEAVAAGIAKGEERYPVMGNILVIGMRSGDLEEISRIFDQTKKQRHSKVVGLDLAGAEEDHYVSHYEATLKVATSHGEVPLTLHAGECGCVHNVIDAVAAGATRIGHGIALKGHQQAQKQLAQSSVCIEGCPTSNVQTRAISDYTEYPLREWLENQVTFCISTDNRTVSNTTLTNEYFLLQKYHDLSPDEFRLLNINGMHYSFADETLTQKVLAEMKAYQFTE